MVIRKLKLQVARYLTRTKTFDVNPKDETAGNSERDKRARSGAFRSLIPTMEIPADLLEAIFSSEAICSFGIQLAKTRACHQNPIALSVQDRQQEVEAHVC